MLGGMSITPEQFKRMEERLGRSPRAARAILNTIPQRNSATHQVILGLDPSLRGTGFGIIRLARPCPETLIHGTISCSQNWERSRCLVRIVQTLRDVLKQFQPTICVVEGIFYAQTCRPQ